MSERRALRRYGIAAAVAVVGMLFAVSVGPSGPASWRVPLALLDRLPLLSIDSGVDDTEWAIIWNLRAPRVVLAALVGGMLSVCGAAYQGVFRNPLVDPYLLGAAAGGGLGATLAYTTWRSATESWAIDPVPILAFVFAVATVMITYVVGTAFDSNRSPAGSGAVLVLAGVAVTSFVTALQTFLLQRNSEVVREVYSWILGRLTVASWADVRLVVPYAVVSAGVLLMMRRRLDLLRVGDEEAAALGLSVARTRVIVVLAATLGTAAVVSVAGLIGFVGLVVPHVVRLLTGASYRHVIPLSLLIGAAFLVLADAPGRTIQSGAETPIGVVTAFLGAPFFIYLLRTRRLA